MLGRNPSLWHEAPSQAQREAPPHCVQGRLARTDQLLPPSRRFGDLPLQNDSALQPFRTPRPVACLPLKNAMSMP